MICALQAGCGNPTSVCIHDLAASQQRLFRAAGSLHNVIADIQEHTKSQSSNVGASLNV